MRAWASVKRQQLLGIAGIAIVIAGCGSGGLGGEAGPATVPAHGKVVFTKGGDASNLHSRQGMIEFESVEQPDVKAYGEIQEDGSFTLISVKDATGSEGAVAGMHRVRLSLDEGAAKLVAPQFLSFERSGITVKVPSDQPIEIKVWR